VVVFDCPDCGLTQASTGKKKMVSCVRCRTVVSLRELCHQRKLSIVGERVADELAGLGIIICPGLVVEADSMDYSPAGAIGGR